MVRALLFAACLTVCVPGCRTSPEPPAGKPQYGNKPVAGPEKNITMPTTPEARETLLVELKASFLDPGFQEQRFDCKSGELPFTAPIGKRGFISTFESQFPVSHSQDLGLALDVKILSQIAPEECFSGAGSFPVHPFICELSIERRPLTGTDVLAALKARHFRSAHTKQLAVTDIPYPGYHPGTDNDEIHNDFSKEYVFENRDQFEKADREAESRGNHGLLKRHVEGGRLWYVLLHSKTHGTHVVLFAVGASPNGSRLIGVVTHQVCHNLCD
jgi:hypothetical protein